MAGFSLTLRKRAGAEERSFKTFANFKEWAEKEHAFWDGLSEPNAGYTRSIVSWYNSINRTLKLYNSEAMPAWDTWLVQKNIQSTINGVQIFSDTPDGKYIQRLDKRSPHIVSGVVDLLHGQASSFRNEVDRLEGTFVLGRYLAGKKPAALGPEREALKDLAQQFQMRLDELDASSSAAAQVVRQTIEAEKSVAQQARENQALWSFGQDRKARYAHLKNIRTIQHATRELHRDKLEAITRINETDDHFRTKMSLHPAKDYWNQQGVKHDTKAGELKGWLLILGGAAVLLLIGFLGYLIFGPPIEAELKSLNTMLLLGTTGAITTLLFWAGRILTRIYLGHVHLSNDAYERATMIESYLSLNISGAASETDRGIVLSSVFRPSTDGVVKDDAAPTLSLQALIAGLGIDGKGR